MSAINIICQPRHRLCHVVTDGAAYARDGVVTHISPKVLPVPAWPGVIGGRGRVRDLNFAAWEMSGMFATFDEAVDGIEWAFESVVNIRSLSDDLELVLCGWSHARQCPEAYVILASDTVHGITEEELAAIKSNGRWSNEQCAFKLQRLPNNVSGPPADDVPLLDEQGSPEHAVAWLRVVIERQRHMTVDVDGQTQFNVGGYAQLTTIAPEGISARILARWDEDRIGEPIRPRPADWAALRAGLETAGARQQTANNENVIRFPTR
jgi:hypothetical protein